MDMTVFAEKVALLHAAFAFDFALIRIFVTTACNMKLVLSED